MFDPDLSERRRGVGLGAAELREWSAREAERGLTLEIWGSLRTTRGVGFAELRQAVVLRGFENATFAFGFAQTLHAGLELAGVELATGAGITPLGADLSDGEFSAQVLSPEASLRLGFEIGQLHLSARGYVQYVARLFGRENAIVRGLTLDVGFLRARRPDPEPRIEPYRR